MEQKKSIKMSLSTFLLLLAILIIIVMGFFIYKFYNDKTIAEKEVANSNNQISNLQDNVNKLQETIDNVSNTINNSQNNNIESNVNKVQETTNNSSNSINKNESNSSNKYTEITNDLQGLDVLYVTNAIKNNNSYTLKGVIYTQYTLSDNELKQIIDKGHMKINNTNYEIKKIENSNEYALYDANDEYPVFKIKESSSRCYYLEAQAQISDVWKLTNEYKEITIPCDEKCRVLFDYEEKYNNVEDVFKNFKETKPIETTNPDSEKTFTFKFENGKCVEVINVLTSI